MFYQLELITPRGEKINLINDGDPGPIAVEAGTIEGLTGVFEDSPVETVGASGQSVDFRDRKIKPITGVLGVVVQDPEYWHSFRKAFSVWEYSMLILSLPNARYRLPVRLESSFAFPASIPKRGDRVTVPVISDEPGAWLLSVDGQDTVTVTNYGDIPVWPKIVWEGAGGQVVLPSGAHFTLPEVDELHELSLSRQNSGFVRDKSGAVDRALTKQVGAVGECVPRGKERTYQLPDGVRLLWDVGLLDPFREV